MIIERGWNRFEGKYNISYCDAQGRRQFYSKALHHWRTYEYDEKGDLETWNGKKCSKVFKDASEYRPNEFDELEFLYELPEDIKKVLYTPYVPKTYAFDIETEVLDGYFTDPIEARQRITSVSIVAPDLSCMVLGLHCLDDEHKNMMKQRYLEFIDKNEFARGIRGDKEPKMIYQFFATEQDLLTHLMTAVLPKIACLVGWNSYNFDYTYIINRLKRLFGEGQALKLIRRVSPTGELKNVRYEVNVGHHESFTAPKHVIWADYMQLAKQYDYSLRPYESYSLDWVAEHAVNSNKIKYEGSLQQLYEKDPDWYYYYNAVDSLLVMLIHHRLKCIEPPCAVSSVSLVPFFESLGQIALTTANLFKEFYDDGKHVVWDYDAVARYKQEYEGAFCAAVPGLHGFTVCDDFASLYPSQIRTCNFSFENIVENRMGPDSLGRYVTVPWTEAQLEEFRKDPNYFVSLNGNVYKNDKPYAFSRMQTRLGKERNAFKYTGNDIDSELIQAIEKLIAEKERMQS